MSGVTGGFPLGGSARGNVGWLVALNVSTSAPLWLPLELVLGVGRGMTVRGQEMYHLTGDAMICSWHSVGSESDQS